MYAYEIFSTTISSILYISPSPTALDRRIFQRVGSHEFGFGSEMPSSGYIFHAGTPAPSTLSLDLVPRGRRIRCGGRVV